MKLITNIKAWIFACLLLAQIPLFAQTDPPGDVTTNSITIPTAEQRIKEFDKQIDKKHKELKELVQLYERANSAQKASLKKQIEKKLNILFDLNLKKREMEINLLEMQFRQIKGELDNRKRSKEQIVSKKLRELLE